MESAKQSASIRDSGPKVKLNVLAGTLKGQAASDQSPDSAFQRLTRLHGELGKKAT